MKRTALGLALLAAGVLLSGCGGAGIAGTAGEAPGSSSATGRGRLSVRAAWPGATTRVVPKATGSIRVLVLQGATTIASTLIVAPTTTTTIEDVPVGAFTVRATAYDNAAGTGTPLAKGDVPAVVADGVTSPVSVTMASTVQTLQASPASYSVVLGLFGSPTLTVTARDASNNVVTVSPNDLTFTSSNPLVATVSGIGKITALLPGFTKITVTELSSGKTVDVPVTLL